EERLRANLREKEAEIAALRGGALSILANRQSVVDQRRLQAIDQLWAAYVALGPARGLVRTLASFHYENTAAEAATNPRMRELLETIGNGVDIKTISETGPALARPHLTPMVWAVYSASLV